MWATVALPTSSMAEPPCVHRVHPAGRLANALVTTCKGRTESALPLAPVLHQPVRTGEGMQMQYAWLEATRLGEEEQAVRINVTRIVERCYGTAAERDDGVSLSVPGYGSINALPHDLGHYVVEATLELRQGFWDIVADGAVFDGMAVLAGRRRPRVEAWSKELHKANVRHLNEAECLVEASCAWWTATSTGAGPWWRLS